MACAKCKIELSTEELSKKIKCDQCKAHLCQACSGLRETEIRVMQLSKRSLRLNCDTCELNIPNSIKQLEENIINRFVVMQNKFLTLFNSLKNDFNEGISQTKAEVVVLRESNIELVNLLTNINSLQAKHLDTKGATISSSNRNNELRAEKPTNIDRHSFPNSCQDNPLPSHNAPKSSYAETIKRRTYSNKTILNLSTQQPTTSTLLNNQVNENNSQIVHNLQKSVSNVINQNIGNDNTQLNSVNTDAGYQVVTRRRKKMNVGNGNDNHKFHGNTNKNRKIWLFVTRVPDDVGAEDIKNYIETHTKKETSSNQTPTERDVEVKLLNTSNTRPNNQSFMVGVEPEFQEEVYTTSFWPQKIAYERFDFRKGQHFLRTMQESQDSNRSSSFLDKAMST